MSLPETHETRKPTAHELRTHEPKTRKSKSTIDKDLDEQLEQTIPASDPPASTQPGSGRKRDDQAAWDDATEAGLKA